MPLWLIDEGSDERNSMLPLTNNQHWVLANLERVRLSVGRRGVRSYSLDGKNCRMEIASLRVKGYVQKGMGRAVLSVAAESTRQDWSDRTPKISVSVMPILHDPRDPAKCADGETELA